MNYTLESFFSRFNNKNKVKKSPQKSNKPIVKTDPKEIEATFNSIKKGVVSDYDCLEITLKSKNINKNEFDMIARKIYNKDGKEYTKDCLMDASGDTIPHALKVAKDIMLTVVDTDGVGGYLLYSIKRGEFYNFYADEDNGENIDKWTSKGTPYENIIK